MSDENKKKPAVVDVWETMLTIDETFVYRIPRSTFAEGHNASQWGLQNPAATCRLRVRSNAASIKFCLYKLDGDSLYVESICMPVQDLARKEGKPVGYYLEPVMDSSRYFVIQVMSAKSQRTAQLGIGFRQRSSAFDLTACIQDRVKRAQRALCLDKDGKPMVKKSKKKKKKKKKSVADGAEPVDEQLEDIEEDNLESEDDYDELLNKQLSTNGVYELQEGEELTVNLEEMGITAIAPSNDKPEKSEDGDTSFAFSAPPEEPDDGSEAEEVEQERIPEVEAKPDAADAADEDDEWGDFE